MKNQKSQSEWEKEEWGGWKIVSDMLDHPDENRIYPTSKCYQELYDFVMAQKKKAKIETLKEVLPKDLTFEEADKLAVEPDDYLFGFKKCKELIIKKAKSLWGIKL